MRTIEINDKPKIFDDEKGCCGPTEDGFKECRFLVHNEECCFFLNEKEEFLYLEREENKFNEWNAVKCDQCKESLKKAKEPNRIEELFEELENICSPQNDFVIEKIGALKNIVLEKNSQPLKNNE